MLHRWWLAMEFPVTSDLGLHGLHDDRATMNPSGKRLVINHIQHIGVQFASFRDNVICMGSRSYDIHSTDMECDQGVDSSIL